MTGIKAEGVGSAALPLPVRWLSRESECTALRKAVGFAYGYTDGTLKERKIYVVTRRKHKLETVATKPKTKSN